jgi:hypothetical protein
LRELTPIKLKISRLAIDGHLHIHEGKYLTEIHDMVSDSIFLDGEGT